MTRGSAIAPKPIPTSKDCPKCGRKRLAKFFDTRFMSGYIYLQSWCRECRSSAKPAAPKVEEKDKALVSTDAINVRALYREFYPNDKVHARRTWKFMAARMAADFPDQVELTKEAKEQINAK